MQPVTLSINKKIIFLVICFLLAVGVIVVRLYQLQVVHMQDLFKQSQKNFIRMDKIPPPRGNILDIQGRLLVTNRPMTNIYWQGLGKRKIDSDFKGTIEVIDSILDTHYSDTTYVASLFAIERQGKKVLLATDLTFEQLSKIAEQLPHCENVCLSTHFKRHYPHATVASHIVGYLGQYDFEASGKMGLEKVLDETLKGQEGQMLRIINSLGRNLSIQELKQAQPGQDIKTTIDLDLQQIAENVFPPDAAGTIILMDPTTGALRALVSHPTFDPNIFLNPINPEQWKVLEEQKVFLNRAFNALYPPASIFKLVTISAALEKKIIDPDSMIFCRGYYKFGNHQHWCKAHEGHGMLTIKQAVSKSCNILFYHIGKQLSIDTLADYAHRFGLGQKTNMLFPDKQGLIPTTQWKLTTKGERWWPGETLSAAIGQSFLLTTPIQIARMIASIFQGYLVKPRLLEDESIERDRLDISKSTRDFIKDSMHGAIKTGGTAQSLSNLSNFEIYGKTGTAQTSSLALQEKTNKYLEHAWFVSYFKYKDSDPLAMVVLIESTGSSAAATKVAREFLIGYRKYYEAQLIT